MNGTVSRHGQGFLPRHDRSKVALIGAMLVHRGDALLVVYMLVDYDLACEKPLLRPARSNLLLGPVLSRRSRHDSHRLRFSFRGEARTCTLFTLEYLRKYYHRAGIVRAACARTCF